MTQSTAPQHLVSRFAPSPTGRLHVGHGWSALMAMDLARAAGGTFRLRIEDIDGTRSRPEHVDGIVEDLRWLGVAWDGEIIFQSQRLADYDAALDIVNKGIAQYPDDAVLHEFRSLVLFARQDYQQSAARGVLVTCERHATSYLPGRAPRKHRQPD